MLHLKVLELIFKTSGLDLSSKRGGVGPTVQFRVSTKKIISGSNAGLIRRHPSSAMNYQNWIIGEPSDLNECGVYEFNGLWVSVNCTIGLSKPFVCQIPRPQELCKVLELERTFADSVTMYQCMGDGNCWDGRAGEGNLAKYGK